MSNVKYEETTFERELKSNNFLKIIFNAKAVKSLPQSSDHLTEAIDNALKTFNPRWRNWIIRTILTLVMVFGFTTCIYLGPIAIMFLVFILQVKCFHEIITIGYVVYKSHDLPWFRTLSWYFLIVSNYFFYGESMIQYFGVFAIKTEFFKPFMTYHRFISFALYTSGFVAFVLSLVKKHYLKQFTLFGFTHVTLFIIVTQSHLIIQNIFEGLIWFLLPVSMIICNDIMSYIFGFFFGRTPLIKLSPKKTWEGFIGGALSTILFGIFLSYFLLQFDFFVCPIEYDDEKNALSMECEKQTIFLLTEYNTGDTGIFFSYLLRFDLTTVTLCPFMLHSIMFSIFATIIGPFGGFFASGFKRAFKIKDFGDTIPGHGGIMDRFDCQFLMATFVHVYYSSFIRAVDPAKLLSTIYKLNVDDQLAIFEQLKINLVKLGQL